MTIVINGKNYTEEQLLITIQTHLGAVGNLPGDITHVFRTCYQWLQKEKGVPYNWKMIDRDYENYVDRGEMPQCTYDYCAEVVHAAQAAR